MIIIKWNKSYIVEWLCFKFVPKDYDYQKKGNKNHAGTF